MKQFFQIVIVILLLGILCVVSCGLHELRQIRQSIEAIKGEVPMSVLGN